MKLKYRVDEARDIIESNTNLKDAIIDHCLKNQLAGDVISASMTLKDFYENTFNPEMLSFEEFKATYKQNPHIVNAQNKLDSSSQDFVFYIE